MDVSTLSLKELWVLYQKVGWEMTTRLWWVYILVIVVISGIFYFLDKR